MIKLDFLEPVGDQEWENWIERCRKARESMLAVQSEAPARSIDAKLYKAQREWFLSVSHKKCAYCERKLAPGQRKGDVEHYRPKGRVRKLDGTLVTIKKRGHIVQHPGYYWLAYEVENLLPSCSACNRAGTDDASGRVTGKADIFPQLNDSWATTPQEVKHEEPALLNPWYDDPEEHLAFDWTTGIVGYKTRRGEITIKVLGLNRDGLPEARKSACVAALRACDSLFGRLARTADGAEVDEDRETLQEIKEGKAEFAAICMAALKPAYARHQAELERIAFDD